MFLLNVLLTLVAVYFAKQEYDDGRIGSAMFWSALFGWDLHSMLSYL
jgi:hypothetical protein